MITLIKPDTAGVIINCDDYYIRELPSGLDELIFRLSIWDEAFPLITEETELVEESDGKKVSYLVKAIDGGGDSATVKAQINVDEWRAGILLNFTQTATAATIVNAAKPTGWTVVDSSGSSETGEIDEPGATPLQILEAVQEAIPGISFRFDVAAKTITIYDLYNGPNLGSFLTRELNLKAVQYKGKSTGFVTRLYPYGRDGLSIESVNSGLPYIENHTYSNKVISEYWQSDSYTNAQNLKDAAVEKLKELCVPERAFSCEVADLAAAYPDKYDYLSFALFAQIALIDETRSSAKIMHRVTERWRYPFRPEKNKVILSNAPKRITVQVVEALKPVTSERIAQGAVTRGRIGSAAVSTPKIDDGAVVVNKIANGAVVTEKIANDAVTTNKVLNKAIEYAKLSEELQVFYTEILAANRIYSSVINNDGWITSPVIAATQSMSLRGTAVTWLNASFYDSNTTYWLDENEHWGTLSDGQAYKYYTYDLYHNDGGTTRYFSNILGAPRD